MDEGEKVIDTIKNIKTKNVIKFCEIIWRLLLLTAAMTLIVAGYIVFDSYYSFTDDKYWAGVATLALIVFELSTKSISKTLIKFLKK